jgi:hypothetical protein
MSKTTNKVPCKVREPAVKRPACLYDTFTKAS